ncbi:MAG: hypothetical protein E7286_02565 [Lachnospiraceae bacterium]|nr:hypothetical protein [Lachnospiraceae bacterium]
MAIIFEVCNKEKEIKIEEGNMVITSSMLELDTNNTPILEVIMESESDGIWVKNISKEDTTFLLRRVLHRFTWATLPVKMEKEVCCRLDLAPTADLNRVIITVDKDSICVDSHSTEPMIMFLEIKSTDQIKINLYDTLFIRGDNKPVLKLTTNDAAEWQILPWTLSEEED